jgi:hypothetical protein
MLSADHAQRDERSSSHFFSFLAFVACFFPWKLTRPRHRLFYYVGEELDKQLHKLNEDRIH